MPINFFKYIANPDDLNVIKFVPPDNLKDLVEGYYVFRVNQLNGNQLFFNDGYPVVAFMQTENEKIQLKTNGQIKCVGNAWVCGGLLKKIYCDPSVSFDNVFVIRFYPMTFLKLFNLHDDYFERTQVFNFFEIAGDSFDAFSKLFYRSSSLERKMQLTTCFLSEKIGFYTYPEILTDILQYIDRQGVQTVKALLEKYAVRLNYKWLERNFRKHLGTSPKNYPSTRRFLKAYLDMLTSDSKELLEVAIDNGYYDDNHLIKDFQKFSGNSPKTYFQKSAAAAAVN